MTAINHALTGGVIALVVKEPLLAAPLAFLSHFIVDMIPHFSFADREVFSKKFNLFLLVDTLLCIVTAIFAFVYFENGFLVALCMFLAASPDFMWAYHRLYREKTRGMKRNYGWIARFHSRIQESSHARFARRGVVIESIWLITFSSIIVSLT